VIHTGHAEHKEENDHHRQANDQEHQGPPRSLVLAHARFHGRILHTVVALIPLDITDLVLMSSYAAYRRAR
jgi:hypothetical protein